MSRAAFYKVGSPPPDGYVAWHEWATVQHGGGLRQHRCFRCKRWRFPQEGCCGEVLT